MMRIYCWIACCYIANGLALSAQAQQVPSGMPSSDSITVTAMPSYKAHGLKKWLLGSNYRQEWAQPIRVRVLNLAKEGLTPVQRGGGHQTKSLRLEDASGKQYVIRSIEKFPAEVIPPFLRETFVKDVVKDGISASYPYAALSIPPLAAAAGIPHAVPQLVYIADDPLLKEYRAGYANAFYLLEEREPVGGKLYSTEKLQEKLQEDHDNRVDQKALLQARMLDLFIMDFDRHEDQWQWSVRKEGKEEWYTPIPRDRDQAFFINIGFIPHFISRPWIAPQLQGFRKKAENINRFNFTPRNFDRSFLNALSKEDWKKQVTLFVEQMTDSVIEKAIHEQPAAIFQYSGPSLIENLKARRQYLVQEALQYYRFLAKEVAITGSDKKELFDITRNDDGSVQLTVYAIKKSGDTGAIIYNRLFDYDETKEIRLYGLGDNDQFALHGNAGKTIRVRIIGGPGNDIVDNEAIHTGAGKTILYDLRKEENKITGNGNVRLRLSRDSSINRLDQNFKYNLLAPFISLNFNVDDGIFLGASFKYTIHGFRKEPFSVQQRVTIQHALASEALMVKYALEAIDVIGKTDLLLLADIRAPNNITNFFRYGNESEFDKSDGKTIRYYRTRYNIADVTLLSRVNVAPAISLSAGPFFQRFTMQPNDNGARLISFPYLNGLDSAGLFQSKSYTGLQVNADIDNRDSKVITTRGVLWQTTARFYKGLGDASKDFNSVNTDLSLYYNFNTGDKLVLVARFGAGINFGSFEFFQAQYLSGTENLRGFRKYRFAGDKMAFNNTELRIKIADYKSYILPGTIGAVLFHDIGRVWIKGESSNTWHSGYGVGIWLAPFGRIVLTGSLGYSKSDGLVPAGTIGFQF